MKKFLAVLLSALMLVCILPIGSFAADTVKYVADGIFTTSGALESGYNYVVTSGVTMTVPDGVTLYVPANSTLIVEDGGKLVVKGEINIQKGGQLVVEGTIINSDKVGGDGSAIAVLRFPEHDDYCTCGQGDDCTAITISFGVEDINGVVNPNTVAPGEEKSVELNSTAYIQVSITEPVAKYDMYDDNSVNVYFNGVTVPGTDGLHKTKVSTSSDITFDKFDGSDKFYKICTITLPQATGYDTQGHLSGETYDAHTSADGAFKVKYGETLYFKVNVDEDYNQSFTQVYIHNGYGYVNGPIEIEGNQIVDDDGNGLFFSGIQAAEPGEDGYYSVVVKGDVTIHVIGVIENEKIQMAGDILTVVKNAFEMFRSFFIQILELFGIHIG